MNKSEFEKRFPKPSEKFEGEFRRLVKQLINLALWRIKKDIWVAALKRVLEEWDKASNASEFEEFIKQEIKANEKE